VIGGPARVAAGLTALAQKVGADELMISALLPKLADRIASVERIVEALG